MNRLEEVRNVIDGLIMESTNYEERRGGFIHLYGVSNICSLLALKRELNVELCAVAGMLHDISTYESGYTLNHAELSSIMSRKILEDSGNFNAEEIDTICTSIYKHSDKDIIDAEYDELLKDADVLDHFLYNTEFQMHENERERLNNLIEELGMEL